MNMQIKLDESVLQEMVDKAFAEKVDPYIKTLIARDTAKAPKLDGGKFGDRKDIICPTCDYTFDDNGGIWEAGDGSFEFDFCPNCGQRILYEEKTE